MLTLVIRVRYFRFLGNRNVNLIVFFKKRLFDNHILFFESLIRLKVSCIQLSNTTSRCRIFFGRFSESLFLNSQKHRNRNSFHLYCSTTITMIYPYRQGRHRALRACTCQLAPKESGRNGNNGGKLGARERAWNAGTWTSSSHCVRVVMA
jgi:hypothetical protein